jgi:hypothetical protein
LNHIGSREAQHTSVPELAETGRVGRRNWMEAEMPLLFFLPMIIAAGLMPAQRTAKPVRDDD